MNTTCPGFLRPFSEKITSQKNIFQNFAENLAKHRLAGVLLSEGINPQSQIRKTMRNENRERPPKVAYGKEVIPMREPLSYEQKTEMQYDTWIKKSLENEKNNHFRDADRLAKDEILFGDYDADKLEAFEDKQAVQAYDFLDSEFQVLQYSVEVRDALLYDALSQIDSRARNIILMAFWLDMSDLEISDDTGIPRSTVNAIKRRTYGKLKKILEDNGYDARSFFPIGKV
jgi:RNA polymerase sigma factor (sigma-70 family)